MVRNMKFLIIASLSAFLLACGQNCRETERMADFELSQGNHARAAKLYDEAGAADPKVCPDAKAKAENARLLLQR
jgi:hypothetical protein